MSKRSRAERQASECITTTTTTTKCDGDEESKEERPRHIQRMTVIRSDVPRAAAAATTPARCQTLPWDVETYLLSFVDADHEMLRFLHALGYRTTSNRWDTVEFKRKRDLCTFQILRRRGVLLFARVAPGWSGVAQKAIVIPSSVVTCEIAGYPTVNTPVVCAPHARLRHLKIFTSRPLPEFRIPHGIQRVELQAYNEMADLSFPDSVQHVTLGPYWASPLPAYGLGSQLRVLNLSAAFTFNLPCPNLPGSLVKLTFGTGFNNEFSFASPPTLAVLQLGWSYNQRGLSRRLCFPVAKLWLGGYNHDDFEVPPGTRELDMGCAFNRPFTFAQPCVLHALHLSHAFDTAGLVIPSSVCVLSLGSVFDQPITFAAGSQLRDFHGGESFNQTLCLPQSVKTIVHGEAFNDILTFEAPPALLAFHMGAGFNRPDFHLPGTVETFEMGETYDQAGFQFPLGTITAILGRDFDQRGLALTRSIRVFRMGARFNQPFAVEDASTLVRVHMGPAFNCALVLPGTVTAVYMGEAFAQSSYTIGRTTIHVYPHPRSVALEYHGNDYLEGEGEEEG